MQKITLNGKWILEKSVDSKKYQASVPGCVHTDLLAAGEIEEPFYRDNEKNIMWIGESDWDYSREFEITADLLKKDKVLLKCHGLDTLATISINAKELAKTKNMYRTWEFDIKDILNEGKNTIQVHFDAPMPYLRAKEGEDYLPAWSVGDHRLNAGSWIRKQASNFGWDWGPKMVTAGIWRDIEILAFDIARIKEVEILQDHSKDNIVKLDINVNLDSFSEEEREVKVLLEFEGEILMEARGTTLDNNFTMDYEIENPKLWWPNGMGEQPLYNINIYLLDKFHNIIDQNKKSIGLRTLNLVLEDDEWGQSFKFAINSVPFFAKGANWIPADTFVARLERKDYRRLLEDTAAANMNMIRVWGGGIYEDDALYEIADELGICIWQDFMFACGTYPSYDVEFMENVRVEAEQNVKRIRHHACLALWCGNNEIEQGIAADEWDKENVKMSWEDYKKLFDQLLPEIVKKYSPQTDYWPASPHSPKGDRNDHYNPKWGDVHVWDVWHGKKPFEWYRNCEHRFNSEFGFQSFPEPKTVYSFTEEKDRNITSYVMEEHQRSGIGNTTIMQYMLEWFRLPDSFENVIWASQILQGLGIKYAVEHWRRGMPRGMGTLYWQLNDCWPVASWSSIDYYGRWKALHYMAKKFYAPLLISGVEDDENCTVDLHVTSDKLENLEAEIVWKLTNVEGKEISNASIKTEIKAQANTVVDTLELEKYVKEYGKRDLMLWLELKVDEQVVADNFVSFAKPKHMDLQAAKINYKIEELGDNKYQVEFSADKAALWVWLELENIDASYSDNFFHLYPGRKVKVLIKTSEKLKRKNLKNKVMIRSLFDTYK
ncbi:beta-mannosidase [Natronospora cellulosivora (SeqCode)]